MTPLEWFLLFHFTSPLILWAFFMALFNWMPEYTTAKSGPWYWWIALVLGAGYDVYVNLWCSILFWQKFDYHRGFLSARMDEILKNGSTGPQWLQRWRLFLSIQIVGRFLEPFDKTGQHCTYGQFPASVRGGV